MLAFQADGPGSIPGRRTFLQIFLSFLKKMKSTEKEMFTFPFLVLQKSIKGGFINISSRFK
jgi:hypothetical protein